MCVCKGIRTAVFHHKPVLTAMELQIMHLYCGSVGLLLLLLVSLTKAENRGQK